MEVRPTAVVPQNVPVPRLLLDLTPLRVSRAYRHLWVGTSLSSIGTTLTTVVVGLQVYEITGSTAAVGLVGLFGFVPLLVLGLWGGSLSDAHDRRTVILLTGSGLLVVAAGFAAQAWVGAADVRVLYALVAVQNGLFAVNSPARTAVVPHLVGLRLLPAAQALTSLSFGLGMTVGPLLAGFLVDGIGYAWTYTIEVGLVAVALVMLLALPAMPPQGSPARAGLRSVLEGLRFLRTRPNVRTTFSADIIATVLAMPRVLFPALAAGVLGGGPRTVGILTAGIAVGSILAGLLSGPLGHVHRQGAAVVVAIVGWGGSIITFGLVVLLLPRVEGLASTALWAAAACMVAAGAFDTVSSIFRSTILQSATPDALRGRLQGIFIVVVAGGPRLGDLLVGGVGELTGEGVAAVAGGAACIVGVLLLALRHRGFLRYDSRDPTPWGACHRAAAGWTHRRQERA